MTSANTRTLIVLSPGFPKNEGDTTCVPPMQQHIKALSQLNPSLEVIVLAFQYPYSQGWYKWNGIDVKSFGGRGGAKLKRARLWLCVWRELLRLTREKNVIGMLSLWCTECALVGHYFGKRHHIKHRTWINGQDAKADNRYVKLIRPESGELVAMSDFLRREFEKNHGITAEYTIPIGVNITPRKESNVREIDLLGAGSLIPLKQYDVFVEVVSELAATIPSIKAELCGDGPERERLKAMITAKNLGNNISLRGEIPHDDVLRLMEHTKIFVHTSNYEGFGAVCIEALHAGAHVVSFTKPMDNAIDHWHHVQNNEEMVAKIKELLSTPDLNHDAVVPYKTDDTSAKLLSLFD